MHKDKNKVRIKVQPLNGSNLQDWHTDGSFKALEIIAVFVLFTQ